MRQGDALDAIVKKVKNIGIMNIYLLQRVAYADNVTIISRYQKQLNRMNKVKTLNCMDGITDRKIRQSRKTSTRSYA